MLLSQLELITLKLDGVADPFQWNFSTRQNPHICIRALLIVFQNKTFKIFISVSNDQISDNTVFSFAESGKQQF